MPIQVGIFVILNSFQDLLQAVAHHPEKMMKRSRIEPGMTSQHDMVI